MVKIFSLVGGGLLLFELVGLQPSNVLKFYQNF